MAWTERYVSVSGAGAHDGTSEANAWTLAEAIAAYASGQRINVKAGTYSNTTTTRTFATAGTTTAPIWWRGYKTAIGDMDAQPTSARVAGTDIPSVTFTTGQFVVSAAYQTFSNLDVQGACTTEQLSGTGANTLLHRVRVENTNAAAGSSAAKFATGANARLSHSWFKATSSATRVVEVSVNLVGVANTYTGGGAGVEVTSASNDLHFFCCFRACGSHGYYHSGAAPGVSVLFGNTFRGCGGDGIRVANVGTTAAVSDNLFVSNGGYGLNNSSGTNTANILRVANGFYNNTSGTENGFGDAPSLYEVAESADPHVSATNLALVAAALSKAAGVGGLFENETTQGYLDVGAVQRPEFPGGAARIFQNIGTY